MKTQERCRFEHDRGTDQSARAHEERTHAGDHAVREAEIGRPVPSTIQDQKLLLDQDGFRDHGPNAAWAGQSGEGRQQMQKKDG